MSHRKEKVAVVTGGSRGIGRGIVLELAKLGFHVVIHSRTDSPKAIETENLALTLGASGVTRFLADLSKIHECERLVNQVFCKFGYCDVWVNNAGIAPDVRNDLLEMTSQSWDKVMDTNLRGPFFLSQCVAKSMIKQNPKSLGEAPSHMIFVTSVSSVMASILRGEYCVSKAGLSMVAKLFAVRLAPENILVTEVQPGIIATDMTASVQEKYDRLISDGLVPQGRWGTPDDVGRAVAAIAQGNLNFGTGSVLRIDGGLTIAKL